MSENEKARAWFDEGFAAIGKRFLRLAALALLVYVVAMSRSIVVTLIMAGVLACAASGPIDFLCRQRLFHLLKPHSRRALAAALVLVTMIGLTAGSVTLFLHPIQSELKNLQKNWPEKYQPVMARKLEETKKWYATQPEWVHKQVPEWLNNALTPASEDIYDDPELNPALPPTPDAPYDVKLEAVKKWLRLAISPYLEFEAPDPCPPECKDFDTILDRSVDRITKDKRLVKEIWKLKTPLEVLLPS